MAKFKDLTKKQKIQYFKEVKDGTRKPADNIFMGNVIIIPQGMDLLDFMKENEKDIRASFLNGAVIILPSNGREVLDKT